VFAIYKYIGRLPLPTFCLLLVVTSQSHLVLEVFVQQLHVDPAILNSLPSNVRSCETLTTFCRHLKFHLFHSAFAMPSEPFNHPSLTASDSFSTMALLNLFTYLLTYTPMLLSNWGRKVRALATRLQMNVDRVLYIVSIRSTSVHSNAQLSRRKISGCLNDYFSTAIVVIFFWACNWYLERATYLWYCWFFVSSQI